MAIGLVPIIVDFGNNCPLVQHRRNGFRISSLGADCFSKMRKYFFILPSYLRSFVLSQAIAVDIEELAHYVELLLTNDKLRRQMATQAQNDARKYHVGGELFESMRMSGKN